MKLYVPTLILFLIQGPFINRAWTQSMSDRIQTPKSKRIEKAYLDSKENVHIVLPKILPDLTHEAKEFFSRDIDLRDHLARGPLSV